MAKILPNLCIDELIEVLLAEIRVFDIGAARSRNLVDPFATLVEKFEFDFDDQSEWENSESARQRQKNLMNKIGDLHQRVIGRLDGWTSYETGTNKPDVVGKRGRQRMILEVKNKHNTMNNDTKKGAYNSLAEKLTRPEYRGYIGVVVHIIGPPESGAFWKPLTATQCPPRDDLIVMNGRTFYAIATDPLKRQPTVDFAADENLRNWPTWTAIDEMAEQFFAAVENVYGGKAPRWIRNLIPQALSN